ncbi:MAG: UDP-3-O-(3-hydroxymyristoyl)glucosamine N-acyltransferase [Lentisphaerota bacterium]
MELTASEIARQTGLTCEGDGSVMIRGLAGIRDAQPGDITFLATRKYASLAAATQASALIVGLDWSEPSTAPALLRAKNPDKAFNAVAVLFAPPAVVMPPGVHPLALVSETAQLGKDVHVGPYCVIERGVRVGDRTVLHAGCYLGQDVRVGEDCVFYPHVGVREYCVIGSRTMLHIGVVIGSDGFGYDVSGQGVRTRIPQTGIVEVGDDVEIGANSTVDRARFGKTRIGNGVKIDNLVMIAHNVVVGDHAVLIANVGVAGSSVIGKNAILAGQVGVAGHVVVGDGAIIGAQSGVPNDVPPGAFLLGSPAIPKMEFARQQGYLARLPKMSAKLSELEKRLAQLEQKT